LVINFGFQPAIRSAPFTGISVPGALEQDITGHSINLSWGPPKVKPPKVRMIPAVSSPAVLSLKSYSIPALVTPKEVVAFRAKDGGAPFENWLDEG
jgi:hypothetical protein